jgi:hypothetical protein
MRRRRKSSGFYFFFVYLLRVCDQVVTSMVSSHQLSPRRLCRPCRVESLNMLLRFLSLLPFISYSLTFPSPQRPSQYTLTAFNASPSSHRVSLPPSTILSTSSERAFFSPGELKASAHPTLFHALLDSKVNDVPPGQPVPSIVTVNTVGLLDLLILDDTQCRRRSLFSDRTLLVVPP